MATETDLFERASIASFYYAIEGGANLEKGQDVGLLQNLTIEFPNMDQIWYEGILRQAQALSKYLGHSEGTKNSNWAYAHYGGLTRTIPPTSVTNVIDYIWNSLPPAQQKIFAGKKDSWNTADVYMVKKSEEDKIKKEINILIKEFGPPNIQPAILIGTINAYMSKLLKEKKLLGISLKKPTRGAGVHITPTNVELGPDGLEVKSGSIQTPLTTKFEIEKGRGGKAVDFSGNSLTFNAKFEAGAYAKRYKWESKVSSASNEATEPRDLTLNNKGKYITATARNGAIPAPQMAKLVKAYTGEDLNFNIPLNRKFNAKEMGYWMQYIKSLKGTSKVPVNIIGFSVDKDKMSSDQFMQQMFELDSGKVSGKSFETKVRSKLRHLRYIRMFLNASKGDRLGDLIAHAYFLSSKMNINQGDLAGPFIKIQ